MDGESRSLRWWCFSPPFAGCDCKMYTTRAPRYGDSVRVFRVSFEAVIASVEPAPDEFLLLVLERGCDIIVFFSGKLAIVHVWRLAPGWELALMLKRSISSIRLLQTTLYSFRLQLAHARLGTCWYVPP